MYILNLTVENDIRWTPAEVKYDFVRIQTLNSYYYNKGHVILDKRWVVIVSRHLH